MKKLGIRYWKVHKDKGTGPSRVEYFLWSLVDMASGLLGVLSLGFLCASWSLDIRFSSTKKRLMENLANMEKTIINN